VKPTAEVSRLEETFGKKRSSDNFEKVPGKLPKKSFLSSRMAELDPEPLQRYHTHDQLREIVSQGKQRLVTKDGGEKTKILRLDPIPCSPKTLSNLLTETNNGTAVQNAYGLISDKGTS